MLVSGVLALGGVFAWSVSSGAVVAPEGSVIHFRVTTSDKGEVVSALASQGLLSHPWLTRVYAVWMTPTADFRPRDHLLSPGISARELVQRLAQQGDRPVRKVTLPEGWTHFLVAERLERNHVCSALGFRAAVFDHEILTELDLETSAEGFLFPAQYELLVDSDPRDVVRRLVKEARRRLSTLTAERPIHRDLRTLGFGEREIVTLASVVEKETSVVAEAPRIARVFLNRLLFPEAETKGRLQSDPTAGYGCLLDPLGTPACQKYRKRILPAMLEDGKNLYNTYRHPGLPPGPISNPGERSLRSVLWPAEGGDFYFVADGNGAHTFSQTYEEHRTAVGRLREMRGDHKKP